MQIPKLSEFAISQNSQIYQTSLTEVKNCEIVQITWFLFSRVLIFVRTNFHENLFSRSEFSKILRELIFANFANFANLRLFEYFAVTYFREFRDLAIFLHFARTVNKVILLGYDRKFRDELVLQKFRENANSKTFP